MNDTPSADSNSSAPGEVQLERIDIREVEEWKVPPKVSFDQMASLQIARWVLAIFAGVYALCFVLGFVMLLSDGVTYEKGLELVKFMLSSILPLVTLAVGYYLGDKRPME